MEAILENITPFSINYPTLFGLLLLSGVVGGIFATKVRWLPTITGFMLVGFIIGPECLGILSDDVLLNAKDLIQISLGLILYKLGSSISPKEIASNPKLLVISLVESLVTFLVSFETLRYLENSTIVCVLVSAIAISSSPAVLIHVAKEVGAKGVIIENAKCLVALNNIIAFLVFTISFPFALHQADTPLFDVFGIPLYRFAMGFVIGCAVGYIVALVSRRLDQNSEHYNFPLLIGGIMLTLGLSLALSTSFLFSALMFGVAVRHFEIERHPITSTDFSYAEDIFYVVLFVTAGASLHLDAIGSAGLIAVLFPLVRCLGKIIPIVIYRKVIGYTFYQSITTGMLLFPMAGLAIGLMQTTSQFIPKDITNQMSVLIFSAVALLETVGPPLAKLAFRIDGIKTKSSS